MSDAPKLLWTPSPERVAATNLTAFKRAVGRNSDDYGALHAWSVDQQEAFWTAVWDFAGIRAETRGARAVENRDKLPGARWFPDAKLNFAENLLRRNDADEAMVFWGEDKVKRRLTWAEVNQQVSRLTQALAAEGIVAGDRVAAFLPNLPETIIAMLAVASLGAIWSSCSPDFGVQGVLDRFGQIEPKLLFVADGYHYAGKTFDTRGKARDIVSKLPTVRRVVMVPYVEAKPSLGDLPNAVLLEDFIRPHAAGPIAFKRQAFNAPLYIMYSSGTTGAPKCIVHGQGGTLLQHMKEHRLHADVKPGDRLFYFTTCGWMMWNWLASGLASEATLMLYDGSPFHPSGNILFDYAQAERITHFGTSAKFIDAAVKGGIEPAKGRDFAALKGVMSTGSPLAPAGFEWVYDAVKRDLHLASMSGGTDLISCFVLGDPTGPVWRNEIQRPGLGMAVTVFDEDGKPVTGAQGELVCTKSFPSMPIGFWNDPDGSKYFNAYFAVWPNVWTHGDWVELTEHGGTIIYGRSDATLNPGGVRIGTAEIYRQVETLDEVLEALVIGQDWQNDVRVVLFIRLRDGIKLDAALEAKIKARIRENTTPRHVPAKIIQIADIPRTVNGKITELAVRNVVHGRPVKNKEALLNPEALELYRDLPALQT
jgi:acetoacetyl-CoA synthetase